MMFHQVSVFKGYRGPFHVSGHEGALESLR